MQTVFNLFRNKPEGMLCAIYKLSKNICATDVLKDLKLLLNVLLSLCCVNLNYTAYILSPDALNSHTFIEGNLRQI